jgi:hypothetical protein
MHCPKLDSDHIACSPNPEWGALWIQVRAHAFGPDRNPLE